MAQVPPPTPGLRRGHADLGPPCVGALSTSSGAWPGRVCEDGRGLWDYHWGSKVIYGQPIDLLHCYIIVMLYPFVESIYQLVDQQCAIENDNGNSYLPIKHGDCP